VSFSAIKSWNVGSNSNASLKSSSNDSLAALKNPHENNDTSAAVEHTSQTYFDVENKKEEINQNVDPSVDQGSVFKPDVTVNDSAGLQKHQQAQLHHQQQQQQPLNKEWNYSLLTVRNENININSPQSDVATTTPTAPSSATNGIPKKPIFNDLLKVPYDVLNAPAMEQEKAPEVIQNTQIHINHQQKFNDTITNYQHFQQFIQKPPNTNHYQSQPSTAMPEQNYEVDESVSLMTNGRAHGVQSTTPRINLHTKDEKNENAHPLHATHDVQDSKFGVVFEGRDFRKYKVEEKTADGFIVG
jgi:hypothetical protein